MFKGQHRFSPDTSEIQSPGFTVSYFKLTIVLTIPKRIIGINKKAIINIV